MREEYLTGGGRWNLLLCHIVTLFITPNHIPQPPSSNTTSHIGHGGPLGLTTSTHKQSKKYFISLNCIICIPISHRRAALCLTPLKIAKNVGILDKSPKRRHILTSWPGTLDVYSLLTVVRPIILDVLNIFYGHKKVHLGIKGKFYTIIYPYLTYCNLVWTSTYKSNLQKLTILHNGAIRCVADISYGSHTSQFFLECKLIKIEQMNMAQIG